MKTINKKQLLAGLFLVVAMVPQSVAAMEQKVEQKNEKSALVRFRNENALQNDGGYGPEAKNVLMGVEDETTSQPYDVLEADAILVKLVESVKNDGINGLKAVLQKALKEASFFDVNTKASRGYTLLHMFVGAPEKIPEVLDIIKYLITAGVDVNVKDVEGRTALQLCPINACFKYLLENGANINSQNNKGETALHAAARRLDLDTIKYLVENGANMNLQDINGNTALHAVVFHPAGLKAIKYLVENGANPCILNKLNETARVLAHNNSKSEFEDYLALAEGLQKVFAKTITSQAFVEQYFTYIFKDLPDAIRIGALKFIDVLAKWNEEKCSMLIKKIDPHVTAKPGTNLWYLQLCEHAIRTENLKLFTEIVSNKPQLCEIVNNESVSNKPRLWELLDMVIYNKPELNKILSKSKKIFGAVESKNNPLGLTMLRLKDAWDKADQDKVKEPIINFRSRRITVSEIKTTSTNNGKMPAEVLSNIMGFLGTN